MFFVFFYFIIFAPKNLILRGNNVLSIRHQFDFFISCLIILILPIFFAQERLPFWNLYFLKFQNINFYYIILILFLTGIISILIFYFAVILVYLVRYFFSVNKLDLFRLYLILFSNYESNFDVNWREYTTIEYTKKYGYQLGTKYKKHSFIFFFIWFFLNIIFLYFIYFLFISFNCLVFIIIFLIIIGTILILIIFYLTKKYLFINFFQKLIDRYQVRGGKLD